jgi:hypothetical protein
MSLTGSRDSATNWAQLSVLWRRRIAFVINSSRWSCLGPVVGGVVGVHSVACGDSWALPTSGSNRKCGSCAFVLHASSGGGAVGSATSGAGAVIGIGVDISWWCRNVGGFELGTGLRHCKTDTVLHSAPLRTMFKPDSPNSLSTNITGELL